MPTACLISCAAQKRPVKCRADELYISPLFRLHLAYARPRCDSVFILSAKHGLLRDSDLVEPYDLTLNDMSRGQRLDWSEEVVMQLEDQRFHWDKIIILAGKHYYEFLAPLLIPEPEIPFQGLTIGKRLQALKRAISV